MRLVLFAGIAAACTALLMIEPKASGTPSEQTFLNHLREHEGYRLIPYKDRKGTISVGIGHNLTAHGEQPKTVYSAAEVARYFRADLKVALTAARAGVKDFDTFTDHVQLVVVGVAFSCGPTGFKAFERFRAALSDRDYLRAAVELENSQWATQVSEERLRRYIQLLVAQLPSRFAPLL